MSDPDTEVAKILLTSLGTAYTVGGRSPLNESMCSYSSSSILLLATAVAAVLSAAYPSIAFQPSTSILQSPPHHRYPSTRRTYTSGSLSYTTNEDDSSTDVPITISIHSLLEEKRIDDAIIALKQYSYEVPASTYHEVIEACCAGGYDKNDRKRRPSKKSKKNEIDRISMALDLSLIHISEPTRPY